MLNMIHAFKHVLFYFSADNALKRAALSVSKHNGARVLSAIIVPANKRHNGAGRPERNPIALSFQPRKKSYIQRDVFHIYI